MHECNGCKSCRESDKRKLDHCRNRASNICIDIYEDFTQDEISHESASIRMAWEIGREMYKLVS